MPSKSRRIRGKHPHKSKKSKAIQRQETLATKPQTPEKPAPVKETITLPKPKPAGIPSRQHTAASHPYIYRELRRIGILAAIVFIILIILAVVIS